MLKIHCLVRERSVLQKSALKRFLCSRHTMYNSIVILDYFSLLSAMSLSGFISLDIRTNPDDKERKEKMLSLSKVCPQGTRG